MQHKLPTGVSRRGMSVACIDANLAKNAEMCPSLTKKPLRLLKIVRADPPDKSGREASTFITDIHIMPYVGK